MELLYAIEEYNEESEKWTVLEHPDPMMRSFSPVIVYNKLDNAVESLCMCINAHAVDDFGKELVPQEPLMKNKLRINFYVDKWVGSAGGLELEEQKWFDFGEQPIEVQRNWAQKHFEWVQAERERNTGYSDN